MKDVMVLVTRKVEGKIDGTKERTLRSSCDLINIYDVVAGYVSERGHW